MEEDWEAFFQNDNDADADMDMEELNNNMSKCDMGTKHMGTKHMGTKQKQQERLYDNDDNSNNDNKNSYDYSSSSMPIQTKGHMPPNGQVPKGQMPKGQMPKGQMPKCSDIYISTKTKISYFNKPILLNDVFWKIPIMPYHTESEGIIKKQIKINSSSQEELNQIQEKLREYTDTTFVEEHIIMQNINPSARNKFKDIRKISIGLRKKDVMSHRCKKKSAFYNCFVVILRVQDANTFREINAKVFNTGKIEIPGIQTKEMLDKVLVLLTRILKKIDGYDDLEYIKEKSETVLINSNFRCGYYVNREKLYSLLKYKYNIKCAYDPCSYPGILCEFYYDPEIESDKQTGRQMARDDLPKVELPKADLPKVEIPKAINDLPKAINDLPKAINDLPKTTDTNNNKKSNITKVSFMIFRTGSVLIVGKCEEDVLTHIYEFIKNILEREYENCYTIISDEDAELIKEKEKVAAAAALDDKCRKIKRNIIVYA